MKLSEIALPHQGILGASREGVAEATGPAANLFHPFPCLQLNAPEQFTHCRQSAKLRKQLRTEDE